MTVSEQSLYAKYINSETWRKKRQARLKMDGNKCRTCHSKERLEIHHVTYERFGDEDLDDLITLCRQCHEAITNSIRDRRYQANDIFAKQTAPKKQHNLSHFKKERKPLEMEDLL